jgi:hypothetical protein
MVSDQRVTDNGTDSMIEEVPAVGKEGDALDSALDLDLDSYCGRMRSETAQGDELTVQAAAWALQINIRILKLNSTTMTIMALTYPGTPPNLEEVPGTLKSLASDAQDLRTITIAHYVHQHGGAGHYNPIFQQGKSELGLEEIDTVVDVESPDSGGNEQESEKKKKIHGSWGKCLRAGFRTPVEGKRGRWADQPPDWGQ